MNHYMFVINIQSHLKQKRWLDYATNLMQILVTNYQQKLQTIQWKWWNISYWYQISWYISPSTNMFIFKTSGLGQLTAYVYQFIGDDMEEKSNIWQVLCPGLGPFIEIIYYVAHILYGWTISCNTAVTTFYKNGKFYFIPWFRYNIVCLGLFIGEIVSTLDNRSLLYY